VDGTGGGRIGQPAGGGLADALRGREFVSVRVTDGGVARALVPGTSVRLTFTERGLSAQAGCNTTSNARVENGRVVVGAGGLLTTEMGCDRARTEQDAWLAGVLGAQPSLRLDGDTLELVAGTTRITLTDRRVAEPDLPLQGTQWTLAGIEQDGTAASVPAGVTSTLRIQDGRALVDTGCNGGSVPVRIASGRIVLGPLAITMRLCPEPQHGVERTVVDVLEGDVSYAIEGDALRITRGAVTLAYQADRP
jgi:heat shock protein HslJ